MASFEVGQWHRYKSLINDGNLQINPESTNSSETEASQISAAQPEGVAGEGSFKAQTAKAGENREALRVARTYRPPTHGLFRHGAHRRNFS